MAIIPSSTYPGQIDGDAAYPHGKARSESGSGARDGTPLEKTWLNDLWGFEQALLNEAGITPSGSPDEVGASQYLDAIHVLFGGFAVANWFHATPDDAGTDDFKSVAYGNGVFVAVGGTGGRIQTSPDGQVWTKRLNDGGFPNTFYGVTWSDDLSLFVVVGESGKIQTSPDGITWTNRSADAAYGGIISDVVWGTSLFVAVGNGGEIQTSPDGITWTQRTAAGGFAGLFNAIHHNGSMFVAVGSGGEIQTSPDGVTWTQRTAAGGYSSTFGGVSWSGSAWVIAGMNGEIQTSPDGVTWTQRTAAGGYSEIFTDVAWFSAGYLVAVGQSGEIQTSIDDGATWQRRESGTSEDLGGLAEGASRLVAVGSSAEFRYSLRIQ